MNLFAGRKLCIATKHQKEAVLSPLLESALGVQCLVSAALDTDLLGTFSGEIERTGDPLETARKKCLMAHELTGCDLVVSSEGSFGAHPLIGFIPADEEWLLFMDFKNGIEVVARELQIETNFASAEITNFQELTDFTQKALFPSHGLIARNETGDLLAKGISSWDELKLIFANQHHQGQKLLLETDMRAHLNPTRMQVIRACGEKLLRNLLSSCPRCDMPGFVITEVVPGLPCQLCGIPTSSTLKHSSKCQHCHYIKETVFPHGKRVEDPTYCHFCNP